MWDRMRVALVAPPFIPVPPKEYGGTELFIAQLAEGLQARGIDVVVYANGESTVKVEIRHTYAKSQWPIKSEGTATLKDMDHACWAICDAAQSCDVIHLHTAQALPCTRFVAQPAVYTLHHPHEPPLSALYGRYPAAHYVCISGFQCEQESMPRRTTIHHGIDLSWYQLREQKQQYLSFIGRIAPIKGTHTAIEVAKRSGIPLKIAGEVQPMYREYFEAKIKPEIDGKFIEYVGLADLQAKNELLGNSMAMLFPIQWNEPFGLVMVEAMACGTPVLALRGGSVAEVVRAGVSGFICRSGNDMVRRLEDVAGLQPASIRQYVEENFSLDRMVNQYIELYRRITEQHSASRGAA
jgi:glycosyltransferase involved in cell wall biosynthesis